LQKKTEKGKQRLDLRAKIGKNCLLLKVWFKGRPPVKQGEIQMLSFIQQQRLWYKED